MSSGPFWTDWTRKVQGPERCKTRGVWFWTWFDRPLKSGGCNIFPGNWSRVRIWIEKLPLIATQSLKALICSQFSQ